MEAEIEKVAQVGTPGWLASLGTLVGIQYWLAGKGGSSGSGTFAAPRAPPPAPGKGCCRQPRSAPPERAYTLTHLHIMT